MSSLISQTNDAAIEIQMILEGIALRNEVPDRDMLIRTGMDEKLLETIVKALNPGRHYMMCWEPIEHWFQTKRHGGDGIVLPESEMLEEEERRNDLFVHTHTRLVLEFGLRTEHVTRNRLSLPGHQYDRYHYEDTGKQIEHSYRVAVLRVLYTKRGNWIVWVSYPKSQFKECVSVTHMLQTVNELTPPEITLYDMYCAGLPKVDSVALHACRGMLGFQWESSSLRKQLAELDESRSQSLNDLAVRFGLDPIA